MRRALLVTSIAVGLAGLGADVIAVPPSPSPSPSPSTSTAASAAPSAGDDRPLFVKGTLARGVEGGCRVLTTAAGKRYSFGGSRGASMRDGAEACAIGRTADFSSCMQGTALQVEWLGPCPRME